MAYVQGVQVRELRLHDGGNHRQTGDDMTEPKDPSQTAPRQHPVFELDRLLRDDPQSARKLMAKVSSDVKRALGLKGPAKVRKQAKPPAPLQTKSRTDLVSTPSLVGGGAQKSKNETATVSFGVQPEKVGRSFTVDEVVFQIPRNQLLMRQPAGTSKSTVCPLCGVSIPSGQILDHKRVRHGERINASSPQMPHSPNRWVKVYGGGLPGLGKRSR